MSKITPPPAMTDEQIGEIYVPWVDDRGSTHAGLMKAAAAARDRQWQDMLAQQVPVAYRYDLARYWPGDVRGRQWMFGVFSASKPEMNEMVQNVTPLYAAPVAQQADHFPDAGKMIQAVPDGYKLVPVKPTLEMGWAYLDAAKRRTPDKDHVFSHDGYRAALAAAPEAPAPQPLTDEHLQEVADGHAYNEGTDPEGPDDWECSDVTKAFVCGARYAERAHGIKGEA